MPGSQDMGANVKLTKTRGYALAALLTVRVSPWKQAAQGHASASAVKAFLKAHATDHDQQIVLLSITG